MTDAWTPREALERLCAVDRTGDAARLLKWYGGEDPDGCAADDTDAALRDAAPIMFEALKGILAALTQNATYPADVALARQYARAAIAKAEKVGAAAAERSAAIGRSEFADLWLVWEIEYPDSGTPPVRDSEGSVLIRAPGKAYAQVAYLMRMAHAAAARTARVAPVVDACPATPEVLEARDQGPEDAIVPGVTPGWPALPPGRSP